MGIKTNYKPNKGLEIPGPGEYLTDLYEQIGPSHTIGTGMRSDLGVGKAYLAPGPGQYNIRGKFDGAQVKFGNEIKNTKIKKTYEPGPATYDIPGTVGNIPKYLRLKQEREALENLEDKSEDLDLL
jgi:Sperm-tail PG-rich repeat